MGELDDKVEQLRMVIEAATKSLAAHRHEGVEDAARRLEILETWRPVYTERVNDKLEELEENTFQTDQALRLCRLLRRDLTGVMERVSAIEKQPVPKEAPKVNVREWCRTNRAAIEEVERLRHLLFAVRGMLWDDEPTKALELVVKEVGRAAYGGK
jgi:hypothetical protein